jgi:Domain of unknown function (DUF4258)
MSDFLTRVQALVRRGEVHLSLHGFRELAADNILLDDVLGSIEKALVIEEYPAFARGPCVLVLQRDRENRPVHVLWGIRSETTTPATLITAYRPSSDRWHEDFLRRRKR